MSDSPETPRFEQLANRLRAASTAQSSDQADQLKEVMKMTMKDLEKETIQFGKTHVGRTFGSMKDETSYLTFFAGKFKNSNKIEHVKFLRFIQLHVEQMEKNAGTHKTKDKGKNSSTATAKKKKEESEPDLSSISSEDDWEHPPTTEVTSLELMTMQNRMAQMEVVMQQILSHITQNQNQ